MAKSTTPYTIIGGITDKIIKFCWTIDEILKHESIIYPEEERYTRKELETIFKEYNY